MRPLKPQLLVYIADAINRNPQTPRPIGVEGLWGEYWATPGLQHNFYVGQWSPQYGHFSMRKDHVSDGTSPTSPRTSPLLPYIRGPPPRDCVEVKVILMKNPNDKINVEKLFLIYGNKINSLNGNGHQPFIETRPEGGAWVPGGDEALIEALATRHFNAGHTSGRLFRLAIGPEASTPALWQSYQSIKTMLLDANFDGFVVKPEEVILRWITGTRADCPTNNIWRRVSRADIGPCPP
jgi:hypothetical protein